MNPSPSLGLQGALTIVSAQGQRDVLLAAVDACERELVIDATGVDAFDSAGVQLLLAARRSLAERGAGLRLARASPVVTEVLVTYGLMDLLTGAAPATGVVP